MKLAEHLKDLSVEQRADLARRCETTPDYLWQIGAGIRKPKAVLCIAIERETQGTVTCEELLPEADWPYIRGSAKAAA